MRARAVWILSHCPPPHLTRPSLTNSQQQTPARLQTQWRVDPNCVSVRLDTLLDTEVEQISYAPPTCEGCDAVYCSTSNLSRGGWKCEFCGMTTAISAEQKSRTQHGAAPAFEFTLPGDAGSAQGGAPRTIFCVDMSGSMCVSEGFQKTKWRCAACTLRNQLGVAQCEACGQPARPEDLDPMVYLSRLEAVQLMIVEQLEILKKSAEPTSAGLVAFNDGVTLVGDGTQEPVQILGDALHDYDGLVSVGEGVPIFGAVVSEAATKLKEKVGRLKARGQTALGPALLASVAAAGQVPGSKVIVCTDGLSNAGLGALSAESSAIEHEYASAFFKRVTDYAMAKGVYVSVVSIEGEQCNLAELGMLAQRTGGTVQRCRVDELTSCISSLTSSAVIATHVEATLVLHTSLEPYQLCMPATHTVGLNSSVQSVSSATNSTQILFQYGPASTDRLSHLPVKPGNPLRVPFQVQIRYRSKDGARRCRVLHDELPSTDDFAHAQAKLDMSVMTAVATEASGLLALGGDMHGATELAEEYSKWFEARRSGGTGGGAEEQLYDDYGSVVGMLRGLGGAAPARHVVVSEPLYDSAMVAEGASTAPSSREATLQNSVYMSMDPVGGFNQQSDEVAENLLHLTQSDRHRWRARPPNAVDYE